MVAVQTDMENYGNFIIQGGIMLWLAVAGLVWSKFVYCIYIATLYAHTITREMSFISRDSWQTWLPSSGWQHIRCISIWDSIGMLVVWAWSMEWSGTRRARIERKVANSIVNCNCEQSYTLEMKRQERKFVPRRLPIKFNSPSHPLISMHPGLAWSGMVLYCRSRRPIKGMP